MTVENYNITTSNPTLSTSSNDHPSLKVLQKPVRNATVWSDVFAPNFHDSDAEQTSIARSKFNNIPFHAYPLNDPGEGPYYAEFFVDLQHLVSQADNSAPHAIVNHAPRSKKLTQNKDNGTDFYCAVTKSGAVLWVTPNQFFKYLATRDKIDTVWKVPKNGSGFTSQEQFRSSVVPIYRNYPDELISVDLDTIPRQESLLEKAFRDRFGNIRASTSDPVRLSEIIDKSRSKEEPVVGLKLPNTPQTVLVHITDSLRNISDDIGIGFYSNPSDNELAGDRIDSGYREIVRKTDTPTDPNVISADNVLAYLNGGNRVNAGSEIQIVAPDRHSLTIDEIVKRENSYFRRFLKTIHETWSRTEIH